MNDHFSLGTILSITTGVLLTDVDELYRIIDHVTGVPHYTHQLPRAAEAITPWILEQHPALGAEELRLPESCTEKVAIEAWLSGMESVYGNDFVVEPMPAGSYSPRNPIAELVEMMGKKTD